MKKSGKVRICVDLEKLNGEMKRETFVLPTIDDVTSKLTAATEFTSIDAASVFYKISLHKLCVSPARRRNVNVYFHVYVRP